MTAPASFETRRLLIRRPSCGDAPAIFARYASDPEVTRYLSWPRHRSLADTEAFLAFSDAEWARDGVGPYLVLARAGGALLGSTGLGFEAPERATTGYCFARDAWGVGYATEAVAAMVDVAGRLGAATIAAAAHPENRASQRVLAKSGFRRDAGAAPRVEFPNLQPGLAIPVPYFVRVLAR